MATRYAKVVKGVVTNICVAESPDRAPDWIPLPADSDAGIGSAYVDGKFIRQEQEKSVRELRREVDLQRLKELHDGVVYKNARYAFDLTLLVVLFGRLLLWREGRIDTDATLPVVDTRNNVTMLSRTEHVDLVAALLAHGSAVYTKSWGIKYKMSEDSQ